MTKLLLEETYEIIGNIFKEKYPSVNFKEMLTFTDIHKCKYFLTDKDKVCNKKILDTDEKEYCEIHKKLSIMTENNIDRNQNINDFTLQIYDAENNLYIDIFNNIFTFEGKIHGYLDEGKLILNE